jgi:hypothetical protein
MPYEEKPASRKQRIAWLVGLWVVFAGPMVVLFFFWAGWWGLIPLGLVLWASYDYLESGDMTGQVEAVELSSGDEESRIRRFF